MVVPVASGGEFLVNTATASSQFEASVTSLSNGGFVVAWRDGSQTGGDPTTRAVKAQRYDATGAADGSEFLVNTTTVSHQQEPSTAGLSDGGFVIVWRDFSQTGGDTSGAAIRGQRYDAAGAADGGEFLVNTATTGNQFEPSVAALSNGGFVVAWRDSSLTGGDTSGAAVRGQRYDATGTADGAEFLIPTTTSGNQTTPNVAGLSDGGFVVAWRDDSITGGDTSGAAVRAQRYDSTGTAAGSEFLVNTTTAGDQSAPSVAALSDGGFVVVWTDASASGGDTSGSAVRGQRYDSTGTATGSEFLVNTTTASNQFVPSVAARNDGGFVVAWADASASGGDTSFDAVRAQAYDATGTADGSEFLVNTTTTNDQSAPSLAIQSSGTLMMAAWYDVSGTGGDTSGTAVRAQFYTVQAESSSSGGGGGGASPPRGIIGTGGVDQVRGGNDGDLVSAGAGDDIVQGFDGHDTLSGGEGQDQLLGDEGRDTLYGGAGADALLGGADIDILYGNTEGDILYGNQGNDTLFGGQDADTVFGGQNDDIAYGNLGADLLYGNLASDIVYGGQGNDTIYGGQGDDTLFGNIGDDTLVGGLGGDRFVFSDGSGADTVSDFSSGDGDVIAVAAGIDGTAITSADDLLSRLSTDSGGNALLDLGSGNSVTLIGVDPSTLSAGDFDVF